MTDYGEMRTALRSLTRPGEVFDGVACPNGHCFGTLHRRNGTLRCTGCSYYGQ